jgi:hypothetical protein
VRTVPLLASLLISLHGRVQSLGEVSSIEMHTWTAEEAYAVCVDGGHVGTEYRGDSCVSTFAGDRDETTSPDVGD